MTTSNATRTFPPKQQVPAKMFLLVRVAKVPTEAKPFTKTVINKETNEPEEKEVRQVNLHFQIADKRHPALCGQWHIMQATDYISDTSKLYSVIATLLSPEVAFDLVGKACFPRTWPDGNTTPPEKLVPADTFKGIVGKFFGAEFNPPKTNEDGSLRISDDGSPFQTVKDINTLAALGWTEDLWRLWPPPRPEGQQTQQTNPEQAHKPAESLGLPQSNQSSAKAEDKPQTPPKAPALTSDLESVKALLSVPGPLRGLAKRYLHMKATEAIGDLKEQAQKHLLALLRIGEHINNGGLVAANANGHLAARKKELHQLDFEDAVFLLIALDEATDDDVPF